jgi:exodeoxyribonuclease III
MLKIATWNINSVRLRIGLVERLLKEQAPDILCLQETKCPQGQFPSSSLKDLGYTHIAEHGQKGYHGVAIVSRIPFEEHHSKQFVGKDDCRHIAVRLGGATPVMIHNFYVPAGGDEPDPEINEKFDHKLKFLNEMKSWTKKHAHKSGHESILVGDLNIAPLEHDVWSHKDLLKIVSHTPIETKGLTEIMAAGQWHDVMRKFVPDSEKLYTWWSYRAKDWDAANKGRRLDHVWASEGLAKKAKSMSALRECRGWQQPSDHVPVVVQFG